MKFFHWMIDAGYSIRAKVLGLINTKVPAGYSKGGPAHSVTLVLLPGISAPWGSLKPLTDFLHARGYAMCVIPQLGYNLRSVPVSAKIVADHLKAQNIQDSILLAHSKGSLIGKYLLMNCNQEGSIKGMVALAGTFAGSPWARCSPFKAHKELRPTSQTVRELKTATQIDKRIISIYPQWDHYLSAIQSSHVHGALENIEVKVQGHVKVLHDQTAREEVLKSIQKLEAL